ncbi:MAG: AmmeMemoRadiSam system protein B [Candidatus Omnitrophica bacterium]|nr:AmmeMemoRadiSam system protein B [Candidatus Omnitrophota bacterium]
MIRETSVAGQFYPSNPKELEQLIKNFVDSKSIRKISAKGIILPHAGYFYSGKVAVTTVSRVLPKKRIIILGPNHTGLGENFSLFARGKWRSPFKEINIDEEITTSLLKSNSYIKEDYLAHLHEHSIEVQLPILQYFFGDFTLVPIVCSIAPVEIYREIAEQIYKVVRDIIDDILLVASSDMSHYEEDLVARRKDRSAMDSILNLDESELVTKVNKENISMCGIAPVAILLAYCKYVKANKAEVVLYQTSGDSSGDYSAVVGYLGVIIH